MQPPAMEPPMVEPSAAPSEEPAPPEAATVTVTVRNFEFVPSQITVAPGTTVTWNFEGPAQHTSTSDAGSALTWDSGLKGPGETFSFTFNEKGTFSYHCTPHPRMQGTVTVEDAPGTGKNQTGETTPPDDGEDTGTTDGGDDSGTTDGGDTGSPGGSGGY
jgi:plastocyanin